MTLDTGPTPQDEGPKNDPAKSGPRKVDRNVFRNNWAEELVLDAAAVPSRGSAVKDDDVERINRLVAALDGQETELELLRKVRATQHYNDYRPDDHRVWRLLTTALEDSAKHEARAVTVGRAQLGITSDCIPDLNAVRQKLHATTSWDIAGVPGYLPSDLFAQLLANRILPVVIGIRAPDEPLGADATAESLMFSQSDSDSDLIADLWGVAPLLTIRPVADFLSAWGALGHEAYLQPGHPRHCERIDALASLFFYTVGYGVIEEKPSKSHKTFGGAFNSGEALFDKEICSVSQLCLEDVIAAPTPSHLRTPPQLFAIRRFRNLTSILTALKEQFEF